ncbi:hypothetical protein HDU97_008922 [Phlyctochytrium planicorne]|nr:hypothetical protein HDU97_008922 [Phlyctochytrium planicorne]
MRSTIISSAIAALWASAAVVAQTPSTVPSYKGSCGDNQATFDVCIKNAMTFNGTVFYGAELLCQTSVGSQTPYFDCLCKTIRQVNACYFNSCRNDPNYQATKTAEASVCHAAIQFGYTSLTATNIAPVATATVSASGDNSTTSAGSNGNGKPNAAAPGAKAEMFSVVAGSVVVAAKEEDSFIIWPAAATGIKEEERIEGLQTATAERHQSMAIDHSNDHDHDDAETASQFSEHSHSTAAAAPLSSNVPTKAGSSAALYTCLAVAELPPISQEMFAQRIQAQKAQTQAETEKSKFQGHCAACNKTYSSENAYANHLTSKKHKEALDAYNKAGGESSKPKRTTSDASSANNSSSTTAATASSSSAPALEPIVSTKPAIPWRVQLAQAKDEADLERILDAKIAAAPKLEPTDCLFCTSRSSTVEENMSHMAHVHSFFIPDLEYLSDLPGLIKYLGEKISVGNVCIYCNGKGRAMHSLEAVRDHMVSKGHCKIAYEDGAEDEIVDFYDFSSTWEGVGGGDGEEDEELLDEADAVDADEDGEDWEDMDDKEAYLASKTNGITLSEDETRLTLASGRVILNRAQNPHHTYHHRKQMGITPHRSFSNKDSVEIVSLAGRYAALGAVPIHTQRAERALQQEAKKQNIAFNRSYQDFRTRVGIRTNKSDINKHFRSQIGFD